MAVIGRVTPPTVAQAGSTSPAPEDRTNGDTGPPPGRRPFGTARRPHRRRRLLGARDVRRPRPLLPARPRVVAAGPLPLRGRRRAPRRRAQGGDRLVATLVDSARPGFISHVVVSDDGGDTWRETFGHHRRPERGGVGGRGFRQRPRRDPDERRARVANARTQARRGASSASCRWSLVDPGLDARAEPTRILGLPRS